MSFVGSEWHSSLMVMKSEARAEFPRDWGYNISILQERAVLQAISRLICESGEYRIRLSSCEELDGGRQRLVFFANNKRPDITLVLNRQPRGDIELYVGHNLELVIECKNENNRFELYWNWYWENVYDRLWSYNHFIPKIVLASFMPFAELHAEKIQRHLASYGARIVQVGYQITRPEETGIVVELTKEALQPFILSLNPGESEETTETVEPTTPNSLMGCKNSAVVRVLTGCNVANTANLVGGVFAGDLSASSAMDRGSPIHQFSLRGEPHTLRWFGRHVRVYFDGCGVGHWQEYAMNERWPVDG